MAKSAGTYDEQYRILRPDGEIRWIRDRAFPILRQPTEALPELQASQRISPAGRLQASNSKCGCVSEPKNSLGRI